MGQNQKEEEKWRGMHRGTVRGKAFEAARRARPNQAKRRAKHQTEELARQRRH